MLDDLKVRKRIIFLFLTFIFLLLVLEVRLYAIMVIKSDFAKEAMDEQTYRSIVYYDGFELKGDIYDANMRKFTNNGIEYKAIILPSAVIKHITSNNSTFGNLLRLICDYDKLDYYDMLTKISKEAAGYDQAVAVGINDRIKDEIESSNITGIYVKSGIKKFADDIGVSILSNFLSNRMNGEYIKYDDSIDMKIFNSLARHVKKIYKVPLDGRGMLMPGMEPIDETVEESVGGPVGNVMLTLDYNIQKAAEDALHEKSDKNCAATVMDIRNGEVLAMATKDENGWERNMVTYVNDNSAYNPGSLFKIIVLAAALEKNKVGLETSFFCSGVDSETGIHCFNTSGHGMIGLEDAFANSCNVYFINLARKVGPKAIMDMAQKFGFGKKALNFSKESAGMVYRKSEDIEYDIGNIAIGQKDIMVTPLQVCSMISSIANNGMRNKPHILKRIFGDDGTVYEKHADESKSIISPETSEIIQKLMTEVVKRGTGQKASLYCGSAGKTGTTQRGIEYADGNYEHEDSWFAGYLPLNHPKYAISVYVEDAESKSSTAQEIFKSIGEKMLLFDNLSETPNANYN